MVSSSWWWKSLFILTSQKHVGLDSGSQRQLAVFRALHSDCFCRPAWNLASSWFPLLQPNRIFLLIWIIAENELSNKCLRWLFIIFIINNFHEFGSLNMITRSKRLNIGYKQRYLLLTTSCELANHRPYFRFSLTLFFFFLMKTFSLCTVQYTDPVFVVTRWWLWHLPAGVKREHA